MLVGDPTKEGLYVQMVKWLAGDHFSHPHFHPHDRFITVLNGTWWVGTGTKFDPAAPCRCPGTFVTHFGKQVHFDGAKEEDAVCSSSARSGDLDAGRSEVSSGDLR